MKVYMAVWTSDGYASIHFFKTEEEANQQITNDPECFGGNDSGCDVLDVTEEQYNKIQFSTVEE